MAIKLKEREELQKRLEAHENETARLQKSVLQTRQKLLHTQQKLQAKMETFEKVRKTGAFDVDKLITQSQTCPTQPLKDLSKNGS